MIGRCGDRRQERDWLRVGVASIVAGSPCWVLGSGQWSLLEALVRRLDGLILRPNLRQE